MARERPELALPGAGAQGSRASGGRDTPPRDASEALGGVGPRMRGLREQRHISLRELARRIGVTPSLISQIETGKINPSVSSLYAVANALDVPMDAFFSIDEAGPAPPQTGRISMAEARALREGGGAAATGGKQGSSQPTGAAIEQVDTPRQTGGTVPVMRATERERICIDGYGGLLVWERLTRTREPGVDLLEIRYEPGASSAQNLIMHAGREYGVVLEGELTLDLAFERYVLSVGDSVAFDSNTPHRLSNSGAAPLRALWVVIDRVQLAGNESAS